MKRVNPNSGDAKVFVGIAKKVRVGRRKLDVTRCNI